MRRLLVAGLAALAVVLGLVVTTGTAFAVTCDRGQHLNAAGACVDIGVGIGIGGREHGRGNVICPLTNRCDPGGPIRGGGLGGSWHPGLPWGGPALYGHQLWVQANLGLDICGFGDSYDTFVNRNLRYRSDIDRLLDRGRWQSLYSSDCNSGLAVLPGGLNLVNGDLLNLDLLGLNGAGTVNVCSYPDWNTFDSRLGGRFGNRFGVVRNRFGGNAFNEFRQLRVNAHCTTVVMPSSTTIVQNAAPTTVEAAPADPSTGDEAASNPPAAAPLAAGPVPSGAVQTGGDSPAWVLAHARAV